MSLEALQRQNELLFEQNEALRKRLENLERYANMSFTERIADTSDRLVSLNLKKFGKTEFNCVNAIEELNRVCNTLNIFKKRGLFDDQIPKSGVCIKG